MTEIERAARHHYAIARSASKRPTLQHRVDGYDGVALCGVRMEGWSIYWTAKPMPFMLCQRCKKLKDI